MTTAEFIQEGFETLLNEKVKVYYIKDETYLVEGYIVFRNGNGDEVKEPNYDSGYDCAILHNLNEDERNNWWAEIIVYDPGSYHTPPFSDEITLGENLNKFDAIKTLYTEIIKFNIDDYFMNDYEIEDT